MKLEQRLIGVLCFIVGCSAFAKESISNDDEVLRSVYDLEARTDSIRNQFLPISPPSEEVYVHSDKQVLPVLWKTFPKEFTKLMYAEMDKNGYPIYRVSVYEDRWTRQTVFLNSHGMEVFRLDPVRGYDPYAWQTAYFQLEPGEVLDDWNRWLYDPAKIAAEFALIPQVFHVDYLIDRQAEAVRKVPQILEKGMRRSKSGGAVTNLQMAINGITNGMVELELEWWDGFANELEIYSCDNLLSNDWKLISGKLPTFGNTSLFWPVPLTTSPQCFFQMGDATTDTDFDGLPDARELVVTKTGINDADTDGDGVMDGVDHFPTNSGPSIFIVTPVEAAVSTNTSMQVFGSVAFDGVVQSVLVNSISATVSTNGSGADFSATVEFENDGAQTIRVLARGEKNGVLLEGAMQRNLTVDAHPPELSLLSIVDGDTVTNLYVHFAILSDDAATVTINGVETAGDGYMNMAWVELQPGSNTVTIASTDAAGRTTTQTLSLISDVPPGHTENPPEDTDQDGVLDAFDFAPDDASIQSPISVSSHQNGAVVDAASFDDGTVFEATRTILLAGTTEYSYPIQIHIRSIKGVWGSDLHAKAMVDGSGGFSTEVKLFPGLNQITLRQGITKKELFIRFRMKLPEVHLKSDEAVNRYESFGPEYGTSPIVFDMIPLVGGGQIYDPDPYTNWLYSKAFSSTQSRYGSFVFGWYKPPLWNGDVQTCYSEEIFSKPDSGLYHIKAFRWNDSRGSWFDGGATPSPITIVDQISIDGKCILAKSIQRNAVVSATYPNPGYEPFYWGYYQPFSYGFVVHSGELAGGYVVENNYRQLCPQGMPFGVLASTTRFSSLGVSTSNGNDAIHLATGQSAQFFLNGQDIYGVEEDADVVGGLRPYPSNSGDRSVVDALGVFTALDSGHYKVGIRGDKLMKEDGTYYTTNEVPCIDVYVFDPPRLVPDYDRNGAIDDTDRLRAEGGEPFRFWINDDNDDPDSEVSGDDVPGAALLHPDYAEWHIDGMRDLIDLFPVGIELDPLLCDTNIFSYFLMNSSLNFSYTDMGITNVSEYLVNVAVAQNLLSTPRTKYMNFISTHGITRLNDAVFLNQISTTCQAVLLLEGRSPGTTEPLVLEVRETASGMVVASVELNISIDGVEQMFRHKNLRYASVSNPEDSTGEAINRPMAPNYPDYLTNGENFVFVHGYNVNPVQARGWQCEMFKKLYWSGLKHKFHAVSWYGHESQITVPILGDTKCPNYHVNALHAFRTAPALKNYINAVGGADVLAAHSLGNIVASGAIKEGAQVTKYFMLNAAVPKEAYDGSEFAADMIHADYQYCKDVHGGKIMAGEWHSLFSDNDLRSTLTWEDEFLAVVPIAYNFYSSGDQVFADHLGGDAPSVFDGFTETWQGRFTWAFQEKLKGSPNTLLDAPGDERTFSNSGGWTFNASKWGTWFNGTWIRPTTAELEQENENVFKMIPLFYTTGSTTNLYSPSRSQTFIADGDNRIRLLSGFIPAFSFAAGHAEIALATGIKKNIDMNGMREIGWPRDVQGADDWETWWWHSDIKDVAFPYTHNVFEKIITEAGQ